MFCAFRETDFICSDLYYVFQYYQLLPTIHIAPASYNDIKPPGRPFDWTDVCDFITEYMHSDALVRKVGARNIQGLTVRCQGILSVRRLIIAGEIRVLFRNLIALTVGRFRSIQGQQVAIYPKLTCQG